MRIIALYYISIFAQISTYVTAAPPIVQPSVTLLNGNVLGNLTSFANNVTSHNALGLSPPDTPFHLHVPNTNILLKFDFIKYVHDRIEHWVREALKKAYDEVLKHRRSELIFESIPETYVVWDGDSDQGAMQSTDIQLIPQQNLTWGMFTNCLGVVNWFVVNYPEWDFSFQMEVSGVVGSLGECSLSTR